MNLVAKEYVAAQDPHDPGVLILSRFAGAAVDFRRALLVNPCDAESVAGALARALAMPLKERRARHEALFAAVCEHDVDRWQREFLAALRATTVEIVILHAIRSQDTLRLFQQQRIPKQRMKGRSAVRQKCHGSRVETTEIPQSPGS
jgi:trehalose 6-phosphate synthase